MAEMALHDDAREMIGEDEETKPGKLLDEMEEARREQATYRSMLQRMIADFSNFKRRAEQEKDEQQRLANAELIKRLLPLLDDFSRALKALPQEAREAPWAEGVALIERKLRSILEDEGVERIPDTSVVGQPFDPQLHEAVLYEEAGEEEDDRVKTVIQEGYKLHGRMLRPALVVVGRKGVRGKNHS